MMLLNYLPSGFFMSIGSFFIGILIFVGLILILFRGILCWYFRINDIRNSQLKVLDKLDLIEQKLDNLLMKKISRELIAINEEVKVHPNSDELVLELFQNSKNITVYGLSSIDNNIFTYFKAKQYNIISVSKDIIGFVNFATIMAIDSQIDILLIKVNEGRLLEVLKECIARHKIKHDIKYIWIEDMIDDELILSDIYKENIKVVFGKDFYKEFIRVMLKK